MQFYGYYTLDKQIDDIVPKMRTTQLPAQLKDYEIQDKNLQGQPKHTNLEIQFGEIWHKFFYPVFYFAVEQSQ